MSLDLSKLPAEGYVPGRQYTIEHAGRIDKAPFVITTGILFGLAIFSVLARFAIRIFGSRKLRWDDGFVLVSSMCLIIAFASCHKILNTLYLVEAMNEKTTIPFREDIPGILDVPKWAFIFSTFSWTSIYLVKFAFMYFFHALTLGLSIRLMRFYWATVGFIVICWIYAVVNFVMICPHFGANAGQCGSDSKQHERAVAGNIVVGVIDIICDVLIVSIPIVVVKQSLMSISQKLSVMALLGLSTVMIICALIRVVGSFTETTDTRNGTAPVWAAYWFVVETCVSLIMASVIVIRRVFITNPIDDDRRKDISFQHFGRRVPYKDPSAPRITTQKLQGGTMNSVRSFIWGGKRHGQTQDDAMLSIDSAYSLEDIDYHNIRKAEVTKHKP